MSNKGNRSAYSPNDVGVTMHMITEILEKISYIIVRRPRVNFEHINRVSVANDRLNLASEDNVVSLRMLPIMDLDNPPADLQSPAALFLSSNESLIEKDLKNLAPSLLKHLLVVKAPSDEITPADFQCDVGNYLLYIKELETACQQAVYTQQSCQRLVDVAEKHFRTFMNITDANNVLLAYSRNHAPQDEVNLKLVEKGYRVSEVLANEEHTGYITTKMHNQQGICVYPPDKQFPYALVTAVIRLKGKFFCHVVMAKPPEEATPGALDEFGIFVHYCEKLAKLLTENVYVNSFVSNSFLTKIVSSQSLDDSFIIEQSRLLRIPESGYFALICLEVDSAFLDQTNLLATEIDRSVLLGHRTFIIEDFVSMLLFAPHIEELMGFLHKPEMGQKAKVPVTCYKSDIFW